MQKGSARTLAGWNRLTLPHRGVCVFKENLLYLQKFLIMTKEELLKRLNGIEWNDFEIKEAKNEVPKTAWETVSAFSNSFGGWIVFGVIHSTVRAFDTSIQFQNPGSFPVNLKILGQTIVSQPRNPNILRFFKLARLSENGGYGIDKILNWKELTGCAVTIDSDITKSEVRFELPINVNQHQSTSELTSELTPNDVKDVDKSLFEVVLTLISNDTRISIAQLASDTKQSKSSIDRVISALKKSGKLTRVGSARSGSWKVCE